MFVKYSWIKIKNGVNSIFTKKSPPPWEVSLPPKARFAREARRARFACGDAQKILGGNPPSSQLR